MSHTGKTTTTSADVPDPMAREKARKQAYDKARRATPENKAKAAAANKAWREANYVAYRAKVKAWQDANPDKRSASNKAWRAANKEKLRERRKAYREANKAAINARERERKRTRELKKKYGITPQQRKQLIDAQGNRCLCCNTQFGMLRATSPCVDHCHNSGRVRGILCGQCNVLLGHANDSPTVLRACAAYLEKNGGPAVPAPAITSDPAAVAPAPERKAVSA